MPQRKKPLHSGEGAIVPSYFPLTEAELREEIAFLRERVQAQSHAIKCLNGTIKFVLRTLNKPLLPKHDGRPESARGKR